MVNDNPKWAGKGNKPNAVRFSGLWVVPLAAVTAILLYGVAYGYQNGWMNLGVTELKGTTDAPAATPPAGKP